MCKIFSQIQNQLDKGPGKLYTFHELLPPDLENLSGILKVRYKVRAFFV